MPNRHAALAMVAALAAALYLNTLGNAFVIDDRAQIIDNTHLKRPGGLVKIFTGDVWSFAGADAAISYYRPLMHTSTLLVWRLSGENPAGYHAVNIALHVLNSVLVMLLFKEAGFAAGLLFAAHPVHTEAVAWVSALPDLQCTFFFLLGVSLFFRAAEASGARRLSLEIGVAACVLLGLLAKEIGIVLPLILVLCTIQWRKTRLSIYGTSMVAVAVALYLLLRWNALRGLTVPPPGRLPLWQTLAGWSALLWQYSVKLVWPMRLSAFHVEPVPQTLLEARVIAGVIVAVLLAALTIFLYRRGRPAWLAPPLMLLALGPSFLAPLRENGFWMGERYLYLPSVAFCWLLALAIPLAMRSRQGAAAVLTMIVAAYGVRTLARNREWRDEVGFYLNELRAEGESPQVRPLLVEALVRRGMPREAAEHARAMLRIAPRDPRSYNALGFAYWQAGERERALEAYGTAVQLARDAGNRRFAARALNNIAVARAQSGELAAAIAGWREALSLDPAFLQGHTNLGNALLESGDREGARAAFSSALALDPADPTARAGLQRAR